MFIGRVLHAIGLTQSVGTSKPRVFGILSMFIVLLVLAIANIYTFIW
nr:MAPEG family protein [Colwellia maritima]